jgi:hypothetical protein
MLDSSEATGQRVLDSETWAAHAGRNEQQMAGPVMEEQRER